MMQGWFMQRWAQRGMRFVTVALSFLVLASCGATAPPNVNNPSTTTTTTNGVNTTRVTRGRVQTSVSASGTVTALQEVTLNFPANETVRSVPVAVGQRVKPGDVLGTVDAPDLQSLLTQQEANVVSAQAKYDATAQGATQKDIDVAQSNVSAAQAKYQAAATVQPKDIQVAQANLDSAVASYNSLVNPSKKDIDVAKANLDSAIASYNAIINGMTTPQDIANSEAGVRSAQAKLGAVKAGSSKQDIQTAQSKVSQAQQNLDKVKSDSSNTKEQARINFEKAADSTRQAQRSFDIANATYQQALRTNAEPGASAGSATTKLPTITPLRLQTLKQMADNAYLTEQMAEKTQQAASLSYDNTKTAEIQNLATAQQQLNDAQVALGKLVSGPTEEDVTQAQATLDQAKATLDKLKRGPTQDDIAKAQAAVDSARATYNDLLGGPKSADIAKAQAAVDSARATLRDLLAGPKQTDLQQAQASVDSANATLNDLKAGPKGTDLTTALAALNQAKALRDQSRVNFDKATQTAPFAGVLTQVNVVVGQTTGSTGSGSSTGAATPAFDIVDDTQLHVDVSVSETDSGNIAVGQPAQVTLDSVPGQTVNGSVERINPNATTTSNVTSFTVRVALANPPAQVRPGATATVLIITAQRNNVLIVPSRAVQSVGGQSAVTVLFRNSTFLVPVTTGLTDGRNTEILTGVQEGDMVVLPRAGTAGAGGAGGAGGGLPGGGPPAGR